MQKLRFGIPEPFVPSLYKQLGEELITEPKNFDPESISFRETPVGFLLEFPLTAEEELYGFGLQLKGFRCKHKKKVVRSNADPVADTGDSHAPVPFFVSTRGYGICVDTLRNATFYCGYTKSGGAVQQKTSAINDNTGDLYAVRQQESATTMIIDIPVAKGADLYVFEADTITEVVAAYNRFSGGGCQPALWGLGVTYRCYTKYGEAEVLEAARYFRENQIPCDCIGLEPGWQTQTYSCSFAVSRERFPHFEEMVGELRENGFQINLWEHAFTHPTSPIHEAMEPLSGEYLVWGGLVPDFALPEARRRFAEYHRETFVDKGIHAFKLDECDGSDYTGGWSYPDCTAFPSGLDGEQMHHLYGTLYQQAILEALGENRTLSQVRNAGAFAAPYPFVLYSDLYDHADFIRGVCTSGLSGLLWTPELREGANAKDLLRRLQTLVFSAQCLINAWYIDGFPWEQFGCREQVRELLELRMSLVPYLYSAFRRYRTEGIAPIRPLVSDYSSDAETYSRDDAYLFGDSLLVAPLTAAQDSREVYLPAHGWYDFWTGEHLPAGRHTVSGEQIPVFVKENCILPLAKPVQSISPETVFELTLRTYGHGGEFHLEEQIGDSELRYRIVEQIQI
ncbi:MAG: TIM-barrel domain-containing protein [Oscillospiraceae bacterium]